MRRNLPGATLLAALLIAAAAQAKQTPAHFVLLLDNSSSMTDKLTMSYPDGRVEDLPAADPERLSILAGLLFHDLMEKDDRLDVVVFPGDLLPAGKASLKAVAFNQKTLFRGPIATARRLLEGSALTQRRFVLLLDGTPEDLGGQADAKAALGPDPPFKTVSLAL